MSNNIKEIIGLIPIKIDQNEYGIKFLFSNESVCTFNHIQDCCENVEITDVNGNWDDLIGHPILVADERISENETKISNEHCDESNTWTFYTFRSNGGSVDVRWHGSSNGYYSENVSFWIDHVDDLEESNESE